MFGPNHDPLRAPWRETDAELRTVYSSRLQQAGHALALEQALDHLGLDPIGGEHDLNQIGAARFRGLYHCAKVNCTNLSEYGTSLVAGLMLTFADTP